MKKDIFTLWIFMMFCTIYSISGFAEAWEPPIGIPRPEFGVEETHRMYEGQAYDYSTGTGPYKDAGNGPYTHYIDNVAGCTDSGNNYGDPSTPRCSMPQNLPPGSVVEVHSQPSNSGPSGESLISGVGTANAPIFIRGIGMPRIEKQISLGYYGDAAYIIVENLNASGYSVIGRQSGNTFENNHVVLRNSDIGNQGGIGLSSYTENWISDIVLLNNTVHERGIWDPELAEGDRDYHCIAVGGKVKNLWVLDNEMFHCEGDGIQLGDTRSSHHLYIGRNVAHHNKQSGLWTKTNYDVIFSENVAYGHRPSSSSSGPGMGFQYDPQRVWFLFNHIYDNAAGITCGSGNQGGREEFYFIGNVIHDSENGFNLNGLNTPEPAVLLGNTIYSTDVGINNGYYSSHLSLVNNIIANSALYTSFDSEYQTPDISDASYNMFDGNGAFLWGSDYPDLASFMQGTGECSGCVEGDPMFVDANGLDFGLSQGSPAIDSGTASFVYDRFEDLYGIDIRVDHDGTYRPSGDGWDIGAYEFGGSAGACITIEDVSNYISWWKEGGISMGYLLNKIMQWKSGC